MEIDFTLSFCDTDWVCFNEDFRCQTDSLDAVDEKIEAHLRQLYPNQNIKVNMYFDFDSFPKWHRQYMPHYFNRKFMISTF